MRINGRKGREGGVGGREEWWEGERMTEGGKNGEGMREEREGGD